MPLTRFLLPIIFAFATSVLAQQSPVSSPSQIPPPPPPKAPARPRLVSAPPAVFNLIRDPSAVNAVQAAISALGGDGAIAGVSSWRVQGTATPAGTNVNTVSTITWERAGSEFRMESVVGDKTIAIASGFGKPASIANGGSNDLPDYVVRALFIPALVGSVLRDCLQDANSSIEYVGSAKLGNKDVTVVRTASTRPGDRYVIGRTWFLDSATNLPLRVEYGVPAVQTIRVWYQAAANFSDYRSIAGVQYPFHIEAYQQGKLVQTIALQSVDANASIAPARFDVSTGVSQ